MPGFVTHYLFGEEIYHQLKCNFQKKNLFYEDGEIFFLLLGSVLMLQKINVVDDARERRFDVVRNVCVADSFGITHYFVVVLLTHNFHIELNYRVNI